jgi:hypothetical protein
MISSPRRSREREREAESYVEVIVSELAERQKIAESKARHVTFRETPSMLSMANSWTETSELGPVHPETKGSGRGHGADGKEDRNWSQRIEAAEGSRRNH